MKCDLRYQSLHRPTKSLHFLVPTQPRLRVPIRRSSCFASSLIILIFFVLWIIIDALIASPSQLTDRISRWLRLVTW